MLPVKTKGKIMKKVILTMTILALAAAGIQTANAGDREWAVVGKVLTGVAAAAVITHAVAADAAPVSYSCSYSGPDCSYTCNYRPAPAVVYLQPAPPPVVVYRAPVCVTPAPVCVAPRIVSVRVGLSGGRHYQFRHGRW